MRCGQAPWNSSKSMMRRGWVCIVAHNSSGVPTTSAVCRVRPWNGTSTHCVGNPFFLKCASARSRSSSVSTRMPTRWQAGSVPDLSTRLWWQPSSRPRR